MIWRTCLGLGALTLVLMAGCSPAKDTSTKGDSGGTAAADGPKIGIVFDRGGLGDKSFNDSAWRGIQRAESELGAKSSKVESKEEKDYETNLREMASQDGMDIVFAIGINQQKALEVVAPEFPDVKFAIVDGNVDAPNVRSLLFKEEEGSFLVGYLAGLMSQTGKIGFVGGMDIPLIGKFRYGYAAGAKMANPSVEILPAKYTGNWDNIDLAKQAANILYDGGADIVYHAAGRAGLGVIRAAEEKGKFAIGVDSDQDGEAEGFVLTSMIKRVDEAVFSTIKDVKDGNYSAGAKMYDLAANGVGTSDFTFTKDKIGDEKIAKVKEIADLIAKGEIKAPTTAEEFSAFVTGLSAGN